ncbi:MAG: class I SAM-dependent methyltransferase [Gammaproteobacteria bacterium]|nr:class I SAM-dependent methyltransferase [Gammaproteobacteria bacterium]
MNLTTQSGIPEAPYTGKLQFIVLTPQSLTRLTGTLPASMLMVADPATVYADACHVICFDDELDAAFRFISENTARDQACYVTAVKTAAAQHSQQHIENRFYDAGFHLDAREWLVREYAPLTDNRAFVTTTFRGIKQTGHPLCTLNNLLAERDLHMDMLREFSSRSDAHVFRYAFAQQFIRPGDRLLDCACGLGYGSYLMSLNDQVQQVTAVDICAESVSYANQVYGHDKLGYQTLDIDQYAQTSFEPFDLITSFETIEHVVDYHSFFKLCLKSLKPDGRVIASVPNMWVDETGKDPNPYHFHEFDWRKFADLFAQYGFILEGRYHQTAPGGFKLPQSPRRFEKASLDAPETETEWLVVVATPDLTHPLWQTPQQQPYTNPQYPEQPLPGYVDFAAGYQNPWLHRQVVQVGQRIEDAAVRRHYVERLLQHNSVDTMMLLTLQGYGLPDEFSAWQTWFKASEQALSAQSLQALAQPFSLRWYVSLAYLTAVKQLEAGNRDKATQYFQFVLEADCNLFCPVLNIKAIEAEYQLAKLALCNDKREHALTHLAAGKQRIFASTKVFQDCVENGEDEIAEFLWHEMAELYDAGALLNKLMIALGSDKPASDILRQCSNWENNKRFGLFNLVEKYRKSSDLTFQADMQLIARSYINKLVSKLSQLETPGNIYIWGTGVVATEMLNALQKKSVQVAAFIDSQARSGQTLNDIPVYTLANTPVKALDTVILTSVGSSGVLAKPLQEQGVQCVYLA